MDDTLRNVVAAVCGADPNLGKEWYEMLGKSTPDADDPGWNELVDRITEVARNAGSQPDGLLRSLVDADSREVQAAISAVLWPQTASTGTSGGGAAPGVTADDPEAIAARMAQENPDTWNTYLRAKGPNWNGAADSWPAFVEWFVYHADEEGVGGSARAFCTYAEQRGAGKVFAEYGIAVGAPAQPAATTAVAAGVTGTAAPAEVVAAVNEVVATDGPALYTEFRKVNPEFANLTDDQLAAVLSDVLRGQVLTEGSDQ